MKSLPGPSVMKLYILLILMKGNFLAGIGTGWMCLLTYIGKLIMSVSFVCVER